MDSATHDKRSAEPTRRGRGSGKRGRPASSPDRWPRSYREMLRRAGDDVDAITKANGWARAHGVPVDAMAGALERAAKERPLTPMPAEVPEASGPVLDVPFSRVEASPSGESAPPVSAPAGAGAPELVEPVDPSVFPDLAPPVAASGAGTGSPSAEGATGAGTPGAPAGGAEGAAAASAPKEPEPAGPTYMGENPELVEACAKGPLFVLGALAELTRGGLIDLTKPVERTLFQGTPLERSVRADPVTRISELTGVAIARRVQAAAAKAGDGASGKPSVGWELVPLALAFGGAVAVPSAGLLSGAAKVVGGWFTRGAAGAAAGVSRVFARRAAR